MDRIRSIFSPENLDKGIYWSLLLMSFSVFISSALAHNTIRIAIILGIIRVALYPEILGEIKKYKGFLITMGAFAAIMYASAVYGGDFWKTLDHAEDIKYNYQMLGTFLVCLFIHDRKKLLNLLCAAFISLLATDICIFWKVLHGELYPSGLLGYRYAWTAFMYTITLPPMLIYVLFNEMEVKLRLFWAGVTLLSITGLLLNNVRGAWLAVFPVLFVIIISRVRNVKRILAILGVMVVLLGGIVFTTPRFQERIMSIGNTQDHSQAQRLLFWQSATEMFLDHPILGVGNPNYAPLYQTKYMSPLADEPWIDHAHNNFFQFLAEEGAVGFSLYVIMIGYCLYWAWKRKENPFGLLVLATTSALVIHSMSDYTWQMFIDMRLYWILLGIGIRGVELTQPELLK